MVAALAGDHGDVVLKPVGLAGLRLLGRLAAQQRVHASSLVGAERVGWNAGAHRDVGKPAGAGELDPLGLVGHQWAITPTSFHYAVTALTSSLPLP